jgi:hypothetical protein
MNATWLLNLYPRTWRDRYEPEFRALLEERSPTAPEMLDILLGAVDAQLRPELHAPDVRLYVPPERPERSAGIRAFFLAHLALYLLVSMVLIGINLLVTSHALWFPYVLWGWGMAIVVHAGITYPWRGLFGLHLGLYTVLNAGLIAINVQTGYPAWSIWPVVTPGVLLVTHALLAFGRVSIFQAHVIATIAGTIELMALPLVVDVGVVQMALVAAQLWVLVVAHWLIRVQGASLFVAHAVTFAGMMSLLVLDNARDTSIGWWVRFPLVVWGVFLVAHCISYVQRTRLTGETWETRMRRQLRARSGELPRQRRLRVFRFHLGIFALGGIGIVLVDLMERPGDWWAWAPIGAWLVLIAMHAGWVLVPRLVFGPHLFAWLAVSVELYAIDAANTGDAWWFWPVMWWGVVVAAHGGLLLPARTPFLGAHLLGGAALVGALVATDLMTGPVTWWWYPVAAIFFSLLMHAGWMLERSRSRSMSV